MKSAKFILFLLILMVCFTTYSQKVKSNTTRFQLNNIPDGEVEQVPDAEPPVIKLITPDIPEDVIFQSDSAELTLIGEVKDENMIRFVSINKEVLMLNETGVFVTNLKLLPGINNILLRAMDDSNNLGEQSIKIEYNPPIVTLADKIYSEATYYGLLIGINNYSDGNLADLDNPIRDAENLYYALTRRYSFDPQNITLLRNPERTEIINELDVLRNKVTSRDNVLIFFAGHGIYEEDAKIGYWLPADAYLTNTANWFRNSTLVDYLKAIDSKHTLLLSDACFAGSIFTTRSGSIPQEIIYDKIYELPSRKAMTSGILEEVPDESMFIKYLIQRLNENEKTYLSSEELYGSLKNAVISNSLVLPRYGEIHNVGNEGGDFIFLRKR